METLQCNKCKEIKSINDFNNSKTRPTGKRSYCRACERNDAKKFYQENREKYVKRAVLFNKEAAKHYQLEFNRVKTEYGCFVCGEKEPCVLDFHHVDRSEDKHSRVTSSLTYSKLILELKKCVIVCANCHRKIHANIIKDNFDNRPEIKINKFKNATNHVQ